jgi:hypothetical protein
VVDELGVRDAVAALQRCAVELSRILGSDVDDTIELATRRSGQIERALQELDHARGEYHEAMRAAGRSLPHQP